jgi:hypothetical protein
MHEASRSCFILVHPSVRWLWSCKIMQIKLNPVVSNRIPRDFVPVFEMNLP